MSDNGNIDVGVSFGKIPTVFIRDFDGTLGKPGKFVTTEINPSCAWVAEGLGKATRKLDGTCCLISNEGIFYKRREIKKSCKEKNTHDVNKCDFILVEKDEITGNELGWIPVSINNPSDKWHVDAINNQVFNLSIEELENRQIPTNYIPTPKNILKMFNPGTYELLGPKVQGNKEKDITSSYFNRHVLIQHGSVEIDRDVFCIDPRSYDEMKIYLERHPNIEGIVWHWPQEDGSVKMAKIKGTDFGIARREKTQIVTEDK